jgi:hypothetical protein
LYLYANDLIVSGCPEVMTTVPFLSLESDVDTDIVTAIVLVVTEVNAANSTQLTLVGEVRNAPAVVLTDII